MNEIPQTNIANVAGLNIASLRKNQIINDIEHRISNGQQTFIATPYSEFLYESLRNPEFKSVLQKFDILLPDGISILLASQYLKKPLQAENHLLRVLKAVSTYLVWCFRIILTPRKLRIQIPETIPGSQFIFDLASLCERLSLSVFLAGGFSDVAEKTKIALLARFPDLIIKGVESPIINYPYPRDRSSNELAQKIAAAKPDVLFLSLGPFKQERWLTNFRHLLPVKVAIGLGGTFDYISGQVHAPARIWRRLGLEWLFRLITQPHRAHRIYRATIKLSLSLLKLKLVQDLPYRPNAVAIIINKSGQVLVARRKPRGKENTWDQEHWQFPQGGVDNGETVEQAGTREAFEETGLKNLKVLSSTRDASRYIFPIDHFSLFKKAQYKGQSQSIVYLKHDGADNDVRVDGREFDSYAWVERRELYNKIHSIRSGLVTQVLTNFPKL